MSSLVIDGDAIAERAAAFCRHLSRRDGGILFLAHTPTRKTCTAARAARDPLVKAVAALGHDPGFTTPEASCGPQVSRTTRHNALSPSPHPSMRDWGRGRQSRSGAGVDRPSPRRAPQRSTPKSLAQSEPAGRAIGGEEQIAEFEPAAERQKRDQASHAARGRQPVEPRRHRHVRFPRHPVPLGQIAGAAGR